MINGGYMSQSGRSFQQWREFHNMDESLKRTINQLYTNIKTRKGNEFLNKASRQKDKIKIHEDAMQCLSNEYINALSKFKGSVDPVQALNAINNAEMIWRKETAIIKYFDKNKKESEFLLEMRTSALQILENKLMETSKICHQNASEENITLCLGIMITIDSILEELGYEIEHPHRQNLRDLEKSFN